MDNFVFYVHPFEKQFIAIILPAASIRITDHCCEGPTSALGWIVVESMPRASPQSSFFLAATHVRMTWGDYLCPAPLDFPDFGFQFPV
jgi:hypothetical protein